MPSSVRRDGSVVEWTGAGVCYCTLCEVTFNSVAAFDAHLKRKGNGRGKKAQGPAEHDYSWMPVNTKGHRVTALLSDDQKEELWSD
jgi:hypothetical protein